MRRLGFGLLLLACSLPAAAQQKKKTDDFDDDDEDVPVFEDELPGEEEPEPPPPAAEPEPAEPEQPEESDEDLEFEDEVAPDEEPTNILEDEEEEAPEPQAPGSDTTPIYRAKLREVQGMAPDEEVMAWEAYLEQYPASLFRSAIEQRIDELVTKGFQEGGLEGPAKRTDAAAQEVYLVQPIHLPNLNPRTRALVDLEIGFGADTIYTGGALDFEYAFLRNLSVHGGADGTYTGWGIDAGVRYAFVKSVRDQLVATIMGDARVNFPQATGDLEGSSTSFQFRPALGFGKIAGPAQILLSAGADIGSRAHETVALRGGLLVDVRIGPPVSVFVESDFYLRNLGHETLEGNGSPYAFEVLTVGLRFYPKIKSQQRPDPLQFAAAGNVGIVSNYIQPYLGAVHLQGAYYLAPRERTGRQK